MKQCIEIIVNVCVFQSSISFLHDPRGSENPFIDLLNELGPAEVGVSLHSNYDACTVITRLDGKFTTCCYCAIPIAHYHGHIM